MVSVASRFFALVPCAGVGQRAGGERPKQYAPLLQRPLVAHTLDALGKVDRLHAVLVVLAPHDQHFEMLLPQFAAERRWLAPCGGETRAASVSNGLGELLRRGAGDEDWVLVHDAARCLIRPEWVDRLIERCAGDAVGGLLALPLADTLKSERQGRSAMTLDRAGKWAAQTPQMFRLGLLRDALGAAGPGLTDEASAVEAMGHAPLLVPGEMENFKVTWPADFDVAARLLRTRSATQGAST